MRHFTLYADIYPTGHKKILEKLKSLVDSGDIPRLTGIISQHDTSNGYWGNANKCAESLLVEPPLTRMFYQKDINDQGELVVRRKIEIKHMPHRDFWAEIVESSIAEALRKPTKGEAIITPVIDTYADTAVPVAQLQHDPYFIKRSGHDFRYVHFNHSIAAFVLAKMKDKGDTRKVFAGIFLGSDNLEQPDFLKMIDLYKSLNVSGYFLVMQDIDFASSVEVLSRLKNFMGKLLAASPERSIVLYRAGMLGALYSAIFPAAFIGSTYGLPYRDSYNIRNINPAQDVRPLRRSKLVYSPKFLNTVKIQDALRVWDRLDIGLTPEEAEGNFGAMVQMARETQNFAHRLNGTTDKVAMLRDFLSQGVALADSLPATFPPDYSAHLSRWLQLLKAL
ncbi:hypothetical protein CO046_01165 [Candidatus Peregrinibacteria bacterium CG_4_9_14_0_2_um_filter_53_11]|nr:MAG: hypothetical protein CO046_01165 [Candidatus Peregrinibacteria bacterium CG_4_9_14_0_2_um_filter_53_11]